MKLPLRQFLFACLLLGAVAVPLGWRWFQTWRTAEIARLEEELAELQWNEPSQVISIGPFTLKARNSKAGSQNIMVTSSRKVANPAHARWQKRVTAIRDRLETLTGKRPPSRMRKRPPPAAPRLGGRRGPRSPGSRRSAARRAARTAFPRLTPGTKG